MNSKYLIVNEEVCISQIRDTPPAFQCWACQLQMFHVVMTTKRELLDHIDLHVKAGHPVSEENMQRVESVLA